MEPKLGRKTSEFWLTLALNLLHMLAAFGLFSQDDVAGLEQAATNLTDAVVLVSTGLIAAAADVMYIWSRVKVKLGMGSDSQSDG